MDVLAGMTDEVGPQRLSRFGSTPEANAGGKVWPCLTGGEIVLSHVKA